MQNSKCNQLKKREQKTNISSEEDVNIQSLLLLNNSENVSEMKILPKAFSKDLGLISVLIYLI